MMNTQIVHNRNDFTPGILGQMFLPKELRDRAGIKAGGKLAVINWEKSRAFYCFSMIKAEQVAERVWDILSPVMQGLAMAPKSPPNLPVLQGKGSG